MNEYKTSENKSTETEETLEAAVPLETACPSTPDGQVPDALELDDEQVQTISGGYFLKFSPDDGIKGE